MAFKQVAEWKVGDRLIDFRGDPATLVSVTRPNSENKSAKVLVQWLDKLTLAPAGTGEYYADVFANYTLNARNRAIVAERSRLRAYAARMARIADKEGVVGA